MAGYASLLAAFFWLDKAYPPNLDRYALVSRAVLASDDSLLRLYTVEDGRIRKQASLNAVDPLFLNMLIAYEDQRFYSHSGVDALALARATWQAIANAEVVSGASTLTMQVARLLEPRPRTLGSKLIEMFRALQLERHFTKHQILEMYLTLAPYGGNLEGVSAASLVYFGHDAKHLTPEEAALLVVLPQAPTPLRPDRHGEAARSARNKVLKRVGESAGLSSHEVALALATQVPARRRPLDMLAPHFSDRALNENHENTLQTYINPTLQTALEQLAGKTAALIHPDASAAILVVENETRNIVAYVGSAGYSAEVSSGFLDMVAATRSPGSTLKPFIYGLAFDRGMLHPKTRIMDVARRFGSYEPTNFMDTFYGEVTIEEALQRSLNIPAVAVLNRLGPVSFTEALNDSGITPQLPGEELPGLAIALGGVGLTLEDLVSLYAALASDGYVKPLNYLKTQIPSSDMEQPRLLSETSRQALTAILSDKKAPGNRVAAQYQKSPRSIAYKTGTSYGFRDAWAIGYDGKYTIGVWVGRPDGTPLPGHFGSNTAAPVLFDAFDLLPVSPLHIQTTAMLAENKLPPGLKYFDQFYASGLHERTSVPLSLSFPLDSSIIGLMDGATPVTLSATGGKLPLQWFMNGKPLTTNKWSRDGAVFLQAEGFYRVTVMDQTGAKATTNFSARSISDIAEE